MKRVLISSALAIAVLTGCGEDKKADSNVVEQETKTVEQKVEEVKVEQTAEQKFVDQVKESTGKIAESMKEAGSEVASKIAEESKDLASTGSEAVKSVSEKVVETTKELTQEATQKAGEAKDKIEQSLNSIVETKTAEAKAESGVDAKAIYLKCAGCHGSNGEKAALGKSQVIKGWDAAKVKEALDGYKAGTYGGVMKGVMKSQVANLSEEEITALSEYIASF